MSEAGLTVGGFYKHFASRDDLVVEALAAACEEMDHSVLTAQPTLKKSIQTYLSEAHRDELESGCPLALLVNDTARTTDDAKAIYAQRLEASLALLEKQMPEGTEGNLRAKAILIYSTYIGAIGLARAVADPKLSRQILSAAATELISLFPAKKSRAAAA
ncbi:TetR/AcrR family transcriptional regulator [Paraburkholderia sp. 32]|uniref:TetR/AcrR family transcriptional regulator n=1 Tax=Paraburkholderia sp. 32 TaxID=2991057 RepID=UPI003D227B4F